MVRGRGPGSSTRYWSMIFSTSFCFSRRRALSWSLGGGEGGSSMRPGARLRLQQVQLCQLLAR